jgi:hypothetical protein
VALTRWLLGALLLSGAIAACREVSVCSDANGCPNETSADGGATAGRTSGGSSSAETNSEAAGRPGQTSQAGQQGRIGQGGEAGETGEVTGGDAGTSGAPPQNECPPDMGECDGSSLTTCETELLSSVRHCGACENTCEGLCVLGICKAPELMFKDAGHGGFVVTQDAAFTVLSDHSGSQHALYRFDLASGEASLVMQLEQSEHSISLGPDRVYVHVPAGVLAIAPDGTPADLVENGGLAISPEDFGATAHGLYYVDRDYLEGAGELTLFHRPHLSAKWQVLERGGELKILGSGSGCLALERETEEERELVLVVGAELTKIDGLPADWDDLLVVEDQVVLLTSDPSQLWWFDSSRPVHHYPITTPRFPYDALKLAAPHGVAVQSQSGGAESVRTYTREGPALWAVGISRSAALSLISRPDLWYLYAPNWADPPLLYRAPMLEDADL